MERQRVAHVTTAHPADDNRITRKECAALAAAGIDVTLVAATSMTSIPASGVSLVRMPVRKGRISRALMGSVDAFRALRRVEPAVVHTHDPELIPVALLYKVLSRCRWVYDAHEDLPKQILGKRYVHVRLRPLLAKCGAALEWSADRFADAVVAATPSIGQNFTPEKTVLVQNFPWLKDFPSPTPIRREEPFGLVHVGVLTESRGASAMIEAVSQNPGVTLRLVGRRDAEAQDAVDRGMASIDDIGQIPAEQVGQFIARSHAGIVLFDRSPNHLEAQPTKLFEYMAAGRPFIASDFPSWRLLLERFGAGVFVDPDRPDDVSQAISRLVSDPSACEEMGRRGRRAVEQEFCFDSQEDALVSMTKSVMRG